MKLSLSNGTVSTKIMMYGTISIFICLISRLSMAMPLGEPHMKFIYISTYKLNYVLFVSLEHPFKLMLSVVVTKL